MRCGRPGCGGSIEDGYCNECGLAPPRVPPPATSSTEGLSGTGVPEVPLSRIESHVEKADDTTSSAVEVSSRESGTRSRPRRLGTGLVEMPLVEVRDPESALMVDPSVPEGRRSCAACQAPVGRSVGGAPARAEGFCRSCGAPFSFRPPLCRGDLVAGQYEVAGCLDYGGLGWIYAARDRRVADRWVVLKGLLDRGDPDAMTAALSERRFLAEVEHPNIVKIHNFVQHDGDGYTVMELVPGMSLRKLLDQRQKANGGRTNPLPVQQAIEYTVAILPALGHLHDLGLLFCDFKPDNVIDTGTSVKLIDLGGVYRMDDTTSPIYGTPGFQAPEIARTGPTVASDLYTVGRTLAVLCTDFRGYRGTYLHSLPAVDEVELFRTYDQLYQFLKRSTALDPAARFSSADEMLGQLEGVQREIVAAERGRPVPGVSTKFTGESRGPVTEPTWQRLPVPLVQADDPAAALIVSTGASDPQQLAGALEALPHQTPEVRLSVARALLQAGRAASAAEVLTALEGRLADDGQPQEWRIDWYRGMVALSDGAAEEAAQHVHKVYEVLPGELAPKLALGQANEMAGDHEAASRWYAAVASTNDGYPSAAFGLARCRAALGDRTGELAAYRHVPDTSSAYVDAQIAEVLATLVPDTLDPPSLQRVGEIVHALPFERQERARLAARVLEACLALLQRDGSALAASATIMDTPFEERAVRLKLEATYRSLARNAAANGQRIALVDRANQVRPRSWR